MMDTALTLRARGHKVIIQTLPEERDSAVARGFADAGCVSRAPPPTN
jgi:hypothetical protein